MVPSIFDHCCHFNCSFRLFWLSRFRSAFPCLPYMSLFQFVSSHCISSAHWISVVIYLHILSPGKLRHKQMLQWWEVDQILWVHESVAVLDIRDVSNLHSSLYLILYDHLHNQAVDTGTQEHCTLHSAVLSGPSPPTSRSTPTLGHLGSPASYLKIWPEQSAGRHQLQDTPYSVASLVRNRCCFPGVQHQLELPGTCSQRPRDPAPSSSESAPAGPSSSWAQLWDMFYYNHYLRIPCLLITV